MVDSSRLKPGQLAAESCTMSGPEADVETALAEAAWEHGVLKTAATARAAMRSAQDENQWLTSDNSGLRSPLCKN